MCIEEEERERERERERNRRRKREGERSSDTKIAAKKLLPFSAYTLPVHLQLVLEVTDGNFHDLACLDNQLSSNCQ